MRGAAWRHTVEFGVAIVVKDGCNLSIEVQRGGRALDSDGTAVPQRHNRDKVLGIIPGTCIRKREGGPVLPRDVDLGKIAAALATAVVAVPAGWL